MRTVSMMALSVLALAACGRAPGSRPPTPAAQAAPEAPGGAPPARRAGLWEQSMTRDGVASRFMGRLRVCVDPAREGQLSLLGGSMSKSGCDRRAYVRTTTGYGFSATCRLPGAGVVVTKGALTGDLGRAYRVHLESDVSGSEIPAMNGHHVTDIAANYVGSCPPGMAPGDILLGNGMKINAARLGAVAPPGGGGG